MENKQPQKVSFKVIYNAFGTTPRTIELKSIKKDGKASFINNHGAYFEREPKSDESVATITLTSTEIVKKGEDTYKRVYATLSYWREQDVPKGISDSERAENTINRLAHEMLKTHHQVIYRGQDGNDINPNRWATTMFELVEESQRVLDQVEKNAKIAEAMDVVTDMFRTKRELFIDFCYAYGITNVDKTPIENLYNEVVFKLQLNPFHFFAILNDKNREALVLIKKGLSVQVSENNGETFRTIISVENNYFYFDGEPVASTEQDLIGWLHSNPKKKEYLMQRLGITPSVTSDDIVELPPIGDRDAFTKSEKIAKRTKDEAQIELMQKAVNAHFRKFKNKVKESPEKEGEHEKALYKALEDSRETWAHIVEAYDEYCKDKKYFELGIKE